ncbi:hypothetical protein AYI68_g2358 [Smittium mucronatum]|uniref:Uncharacterized protein n=1 Tax=Smittium mucronatum TaxID=133383 RepID=A0A1R0H2Y7_9FUNG|nr:hypothetical protein AYI68_g2358 [Smittium mucronatum]
MLDTFLAWKHLSKKVPGCQQITAPVPDCKDYISAVSILIEYGLMVCHKYWLITGLRKLMGKVTDINIYLKNMTCLAVLAHVQSTPPSRLSWIRS